MKTYIANKDYVLVNGEVYFVGEKADAPKHINKYVINFEGVMQYNWTMHFGKFDVDSREITATTDKNIPGVKHLDRNIFVKPDVDVEGLAKSKYPYDNEDFTSSDIGTLKTFADIFIKGFNSNPNQFTWDEYKEAIQLAYIHGQQNVVSKEFAIKSIFELHRPIDKLPDTIQADEEFNNVIPKWK